MTVASEDVIPAAAGGEGAPGGTEGDMSEEEQRVLFDEIAEDGDGKPAPGDGDEGEPGAGEGEGEGGDKDVGEGEGAPPEKTALELLHEQAKAYADQSKTAEGVTAPPEGDPPAKPAAAEAAKPPDAAAPPAKPPAGDAGLFDQLIESTGGNLTFPDPENEGETKTVDLAGLREDYGHELIYLVEALAKQATSGVTAPAPAVTAEQFQELQQELATERLLSAVATEQPRVREIVHDEAFWTFVDEQPDHVKMWVEQGGVDGVSHVVAAFLEKTAQGAADKRDAEARSAQERQNAILGSTSRRSRAPAKGRKTGDEEDDWTEERARAEFERIAE